MKHLYAPWRSSYAERADKAKEDGGREDCIFCAIIENPENDEQNFVLSRFDGGIVMLNRFPYNPGHLLIVPYQHVESVETVDQKTRALLMEYATQATTLLKQKLGAHGINIGINLGKAAGAGIPAHLHIHVLPRFYGDTNFLPTLTDTKQISFDLHELYRRLKGLI